MNQVERNRESAFDGMERLTLELARRLSSGDRLYQCGAYNADGTARRWKVTSVKTWQRNPARIEIRVQHGMYAHDTLRESDLSLVLIDQRTHARVSRLASGLMPYRVRRMVGDTSYTWCDAWIDPITRCVYLDGTLVLTSASHCAQCGAVRTDQSDRMNPYPSMCSVCSTRDRWVWFDAAIGPDQTVDA